MSRARDIADSTATLSVDGGTIKLDGNHPFGTGNVALGNTALDSLTTGGNYNTAVGGNAMTGNTTGNQNVAVGFEALLGNTTGYNNNAVGLYAGRSNTTGLSNVAVGTSALRNNTTASENTAVGYQALYNNTTGTPNNALGRQALRSNTTGNANNGFGEQALQANTTGSYNTAVGNLALASNTTASNNTSVGYRASYNNTTGRFNSSLGQDSLYSNTTGQYNVAIGYSALENNTTASFSTTVGTQAGYNSTGGYNTFLGYGAGYHVSTGSNNTIVGLYNGNQGGLDIRTSSNYIVLSDGDGNPRLFILDNGQIRVPEVYNTTTGNSANMFVDSFGKFFRSTSSLKYKNTVNDATHGLTELLTLRPITYKGNSDGDTVFGGLIAEEVHDAGLTEFVQYDTEGNPDALAYGNMVSLCIKAIQELSAKNDALEVRIAQLENA